MDIAERFRAVNDFVGHLGRFGGFPNFHEASYPHSGQVYGSIVVNDVAADWVDVPAVELGDPAGHDVTERFRRTHEWAVARGYAGGFPNFHQADYGAGVVYGTVLLTAAGAKHQDVSAAELGDPPVDDVAERFRRVHDWAVARGYAGGFPNFHQADYGAGVVYGIVLLTDAAGEQMDLPVKGLLEMLRQQSPFGRFLPSAHGFPFKNSWPDVGVFEIDLGITSIDVGSARAGLCGGMVFAAADYFHGETVIPTAKPTKGSPLWGFISNRFRDSFNLPLGPLKYLDYMNPARRDHDTVLSKWLGLRGRDWMILDHEWPTLRARLDRDELVPVAWVHRKSASLTRIGDNHVVLAYRYENDGPMVRVYVYDPNVGTQGPFNADDQWFAFRTDSTAALDRVHRSTDGQRIHIFFPLDYTPSRLPQL